MFEPRDHRGRGRGRGFGLGRQIVVLVGSRMFQPRWKGARLVRGRSAWSVRGSPPPRPHATGRFAAMARSADGSLRGRRTVRWPLLRLAGMRARTPAALGNAAAESTPALRHAELDL
jgi:hypothetical protein